MDTTIPVFDEIEVKMEIEEDAKRSKSNEFVDSGPGATETQSDMLGLDLEHQNRQYESGSQCDDDDDDSDIYSTLSSESQSDGEELMSFSMPVEPDYPAVTQTGPSKKLPSYMESVLEDFRDQLIFSKSIRISDGLNSHADRIKAAKLLLEWQKLNPECHDKLEKQLTNELLSYAFVKSSVQLNESHQSYYLSDVSNRGKLKDPGFFASVIPATNSGDSEILNFFNKLKEHESFHKYTNYIDTLSEDQISSIVWDASVKAQRIIMKLSKLHEASLTTLDKIIKLNREVVESVENECQVLEQHVRAEAEKVSQIAVKSELTTVGRKQLYRGLLAPYFKTVSGLAAPLWKPVPAPFKIEDLRQAALTAAELELLQASVLETVRETQKSYAEDRCCQLLLKSAERDPPSLELKIFSVPITTPLLYAPSPSSINASIKCEISTLLRWKESLIKKAKSITLEEIVNDPTLPIDWLSVSAKMNAHITKSFNPEEFERIWKKLILPGLLTNKKMTLAQIRKLMDCVSTHGLRKWDKVAEEMGPGFTPFMCFSAYESFRPGELSAEERSIINHRELQTGSACFQKIVKLGKDFLPHMSIEKFSSLSCQVAGLLADTPNIPVQTLAENYNRFSNPDTVKGGFRFVEDLILLVCMLKMREYLKMAASFAPLKDYLPWRFVSAWAARADVLFMHKRTLWSRDEDLKLLSYAKTHRKFDWKLFSARMGPDKNRKNTRSRYIYLVDRLQQESFDKIREEYESKDRTRRLYLNYEKFVAPLKTTLSLPQCKPPSYEVLRSNPSESSLWSYLASFDRDVIQETISDLEQIIKYSTEAMQSEASKLDSSVGADNSGQPGGNHTTHATKKPIDRRRFIRGDAESTASSIHLRKLTLKPREQVGTLSSYQEDIYYYFEYYKGRTVKSTTKHTYIPKVEVFMKMAELQTIVNWPSNVVAGSEECKETDGVALDATGCPIVADLPKPPRRKKRRGVISDKKGRKKKVIPDENETEQSCQKEKEEEEEDSPKDRSSDPESASESKSCSQSTHRVAVKVPEEVEVNTTTAETKEPSTPTSTFANPNEIIIKEEDSSMFFEES